MRRSNLTRVNCYNPKHGRETSSVASRLPFPAKGEISDDTISTSMAFSRSLIIGLTLLFVK